MVTVNQRVLEFAYTVHLVILKYAISNSKIIYVFLMRVSTHSSDRVRCYMRVGLAKCVCMCVCG